MTKNYSREHLKLSVAKTLQTLGWHSINTTPLEVLTDILSTFIENIGRTTNQYASEFGHTEPNLDHLGLAFRDMGIELQELEEYTTFVNFGPPPTPVPKYPVPKENHLNFLKPGSKEVVTRPVHIHEHLPPMHPLLEGAEADKEVVVKEEVVEEPVQENPQVFKKPIDISPSEFKRAACRKEEESSRPTRELSSVIMTTSGYLSPAREGKLPESRTPIPPVEPAFPPQPPPQENAEPVVKKQLKPIKKPEKKREKIGKELFKPISDENKKKVPAMKDHAKTKQKSSILNNLPNGTEVKISQVPIMNKPANTNKVNRNLPPAALEIEKFNTTITPIPMKTLSQETNQDEVHDLIDKLLTEPDKKKLNNLKKIFNVKDVKGAKKEDKLKSRENSPSLVNEMSASEIATKLSSLPCDVTIEPINTPKAAIHEKPDRVFFDGHPLTPLVSKRPNAVPRRRAPPQPREKRKRKPKVPKILKHANLPFNPETMDMKMERPITPDAALPLKQEPTFPHMPQVPLPLGYPFPPFGGPGLIPSPLHLNPLAPNPMFPFGLGQMPYLPLRGAPPRIRNSGPVPGFNHSIKSEEPPAKIPKIEKNQSSPAPVNLHREQHHKAPPSPQPQAPSSPVPPPQQPQPQQQHPPPHQQHPQPHQQHPQPHQQHPQPHQQHPQPNQQHPQHNQPPPTALPSQPPLNPPQPEESFKPEKKIKEHKKDKKDKIKKKNKKDKIKNKSEKKKKLKIEKKDKEKIKREKKEKRKEKEAAQQIKEVESVVPKLTLKLESSSRPATPEMKKLNIKPIVRKDETPCVVSSSTDEIKRATSPGLAKISALVTGPPKQKTVAPPPPVEEIPREGPPVPPVPRSTQGGPGRPRIHPVLPPKPPIEPVKKDEDGNDVWICPACGNQDDGSPMIGCDDCDAWYHWVCVGIRTEPDENENWYCRYCLMKKNENLQIEKKKKRKKKEKKEH